MLKLSKRSSIVACLLYFSILLTGCSQSEKSTAQTPSATQATPNSTDSTNVLSTPQKTAQNQTPGGHDIELLYGKWKPIAYIDANGQETDLTALPDAQKATFSWEFTREGAVKFGEIQGTFEVQGDRIIAKNESSGNEKQFDFSVGETELRIISDDGVTLKLAREE